MPKVSPPSISEGAQILDQNTVYNQQVFESVGVMPEDTEG